MMNDKRNGVPNWGAVSFYSLFLRLAFERRFVFRKTLYFRLQRTSRAKRCGALSIYHSSYHSSFRKMPFVSAGQLVRSAPTALENDPLGLVAENLRASPYGAIAVVDRVLPVEGEYGQAAQSLKNVAAPRLLGLIDERDLSRAALPALNAHPARAVAVVPSGFGSTPEKESSSAAENFSDSHSSSQTNGAVANGSSNHFAASHSNGSTPAAKSVTALTAREVMRADFGFIPAAFSLHNALLTLDRYDSSALPVMDADGRYLGLISRSDVVAALGENIRPPVVGGMATPLGVWLTDGRLTGGAPPLGLFLSGLVLATCYFAAHLIVLLGLAAMNSTWAAQFYSGRVGLDGGGGGMFDLLVTGAQGLLFVLAVRLTPMAGIHAAEHQTVWAIERGLPLVPEVVEQMPRAHPRCGTNVMALVGLVTIWLQHLPSFDNTNILFSLIFTFFFWRQFGTALQEYFTTRPATRKQIESGIKAGREIMEKYQSQPHMPTPFIFRLLNSGMIYAFGGMMLGMYVFFFLESLAARWILRF
jgi:CBS domain-containing protein